MDRVGEYLVKGVVGEGGMGVVYEGVQPVIGKRVAIKLLKPHGAADANEARRLLDEARLVNAIGHRGIIDIFSFGELDDGRQYFVMEYLVGVPLAKHIKEHSPLPPSDVLQILDEMMAALGSAHEQGVIHRDLKPSNVYLVVQGDGSSYVKVLDFGLAKRGLYANGAVLQTSASHVMGTPEFMAPEQMRGEAVSPRTDLYAAGVLAFEMLTGRLPFQAASVAEVIRAHLNDTPPSPSTFVEGIPVDVDALVLKLLEKAPADRPRTAEQVRQQIRFIRSENEFHAATRLAVPPKPDEPVGPRIPPRPPRDVGSDEHTSPIVMPVEEDRRTRTAAGQGRKATPASWSVPGAEVRLDRPGRETVTPPPWALPGGEVKLGRPTRSEETVVKLPPRRTLEKPRVTDRVAPSEMEMPPVTARLSRPVRTPRFEWLVRLGAVALGALAVIAVQAWPSASGPTAPRPLDRSVLVGAAPQVAESEAPVSDRAEQYVEQAEGEAAVDEPQAGAEAQAKEPAAKEPATGGSMRAPVKQAPRVRGMRFVTPNGSVADAVQQRLKRVRSGWFQARKGMPEVEAKGFDLALQQCERYAKGTDKVEAMRCLDEFVRLAFADREP